MKKYSRTGHRVPREAPARNNAVVSARARRQTLPSITRVRGGGRRQDLVLPPETWYEPIEDKAPGYRVVVKNPGNGYRHVVTPQEIRARLSDFSDELLRPLQVVQLSQMTRKKGQYPCYGMQWGQALYLYPIEESLTETFVRPPKPAQWHEARQFGGKWVEAGGGRWNLVWTVDALRDFYLNNILIHELGHLVDNRNTTFKDRERYAEWFAIEYGYRASRGARS